jgi:hypothetical protein
MNFDDNHLDDHGNVDSSSQAVLLQLPLPSPISSQFGVGNEILFYSSFSANEKHKNSEILQYLYDSNPPQINHLLYSWHHLFIQTHSYNSVEQLLLQSRAYRAELELFLLAEAEQLGVGAKNSAEYNSYLLLLESAKSLFHLFEIMYLDNHSNITVQLVDWLQRSFPAPELTNLTVDNEDYWIVIYQLIIQGRINQAVQLLKLNTIMDQYSPGLKSQIIELLSNLPSLSNKYSDLNSLINTFQAWQEAANNIVQKNISVVNSNPQLDRLFCLLLGEIKATLYSHLDQYPLTPRGHTNSHFLSACLLTCQGMNQ